MAEIQFSNCVALGQFSTPELNAVAAFDDYFSFSGRKYQVIKSIPSNNKPTYAVELVKTNPNIALNILKVVSFLTGIIPLIMLIGKLICRSNYTFTFDAKPKPRPIPDSGKPIPNPSLPIADPQKDEIKLSSDKKDAIPSEASAKGCEIPALSGQPVADKNLDGYFDLVDSWSLLDGMLGVLEKKINSKDFFKTTAARALSYYQNELLLIGNNIKQLAVEGKNVIEPLLAKKLAIGIEDESLELLALDDTSKKFCIRYANLSKYFDSQISQIAKNEGQKQVKVQGISNPNTICYIISAFQPLLANNNFLSLVPDSIQPYLNEGPEEFEGRKNILASVKKFLKAWKEGKSSYELGQLLAELRICFFDAALFQGGFLNKDNLIKFQDAGSFFELLLYVIGQSFDQKMTRKPLSPDARLKDYVKEETEQRGVFYLKGEGVYNKETKVFYPKPNQSVHSLVNRNAMEIKDEFNIGDEWKIDVPSHADSSKKEKVVVSSYSEKYKIQGKPPALLIVRTDGIVVDPALDGKIDFSGLFEEKVSSNDAMYELSGFAQNHNQNHWTSVVHAEGKWLYCNDSKVSEVTPQSADFKFPAHYLVYKKKT